MPSSEDLRPGDRGPGRRSVSVAAATRDEPVDRPWDGAAGTGDRDASHTAEHLGDTLSSVTQVLARPDDRLVRFTAVVEGDRAPGVSGRC
jgi:hypothetical protein